MRTATPEQRARAQERRERIRKLAKTIADMPETDRLQLASSHGLRTIEGRELSVFNHCLLLTQNPNISVLGGFRQWKKAGRSVMKGQHGLSLWCPISPKDKPDADELNENRTRFILGTVFDISQTRELGADEPETEPETNGNGFHANGNGEVRRPQVTADITEGEFQPL